MLTALLSIRLKLVGMSSTGPSLIGDSGGTIENSKVTTRMRLTTKSSYQAEGV
jgi:hypothetical protein